MKVAVIGSGGFIGQRLIKLLLERDDVSRLSLLDVIDYTAPESSRVVAMKGDLGDPQVRQSVVEGADKVIFLAAILGGTAEANYALARRVNIDATLDLFEYLRDHAPRTRLVFASTIAVYAKPMPQLVDDATPTGPAMLYGAQKLMMEIALSNFAARGWLEGLSLRPSGVMARDGADARLKSAFMSRLFYAVMRGEDIVLPVAPESRTWLTSVDAVARNFLHGAMLDAAALGNCRAFTLPALCLSFAELVDALKRRFPTSGATVSFAPDPETVALFGSYPPLSTAVADRLGFQRDADADELVLRSLD
jgi:D-erythronate 2-dehydrogenase